MLHDVPPVPGPALLTRILPVPHLLPGGLVFLDPLAELPILQPRSREHGQEASAPPADVVHGLGVTELAVRNVEEVLPAHRPAEPIPGLLVGARVVLRSRLAPKLHRDPAVPGRSE
ncbi:hypothetical protein HKBW3S06_00747 [Candidatus Hakubella thermalkaliphila]|uniref:Uncharacterized protein n=1 Tax=Candidatus Hakubella thermalkaliphila TaxID=2754717 RepID=A0A6V8NQ83_9ACTN|nr:hypothetical protein HKBW3S06_00747 [Candidatus Hakubella thermalkaliphila]GFP42719.1 hypothetical protein HKBW3C_01843 [Candidatus Hakubella thermalkaliphila]